MRNILRNWRSTLAGLLTLLGVGAHIYQTPSAAADPAVAAAIAAGVGLIVSKDANQTGTAEPAK